MASKMVTRRQATTSAVEAAASTHADEVAERLAPLFATPERPADDLRPAFLSIQQGLAGVLRAHREALEGADSAHIEELRGDIGPRERRDAAVAELYTRVSSVRDAVEALYGAGAAAKLFALRGPTPRNPEVLRRQAERVLQRLRDATDPLPAPVVSGLIAEPEAWAAELEPALGELVAALEAVYADRRRAEITFRRKQRALDRHGRTYQAATSILGGLYHLSGLDEYEQRLRPSVPQTGVAVEAPGEEEPPEAPPLEPGAASPTPIAQPTATAPTPEPANDDTAEPSSARPARRSA